jgi:hypothetical protein
MPLLREIKWTRLGLAIFATVLVADTIPHPNLSPGLLKSSLAWMQQASEGNAPTTVLVKSDR